MIVPRYWSESRTRKFANGHQFTIKRFGWSDTSERDAKTHADERLQEAVETLERDGHVRRIDHKTSYNGAEGIPIREEVIDKTQDVVISRNSYGALCLNTPDVLFADIDFEFEASIKTYVVAFSILAILTLIATFSFQSWKVLLVGLFASIIFTSTVADLLHKIVLLSRGDPEKRAIETVKRVSENNTELHIRLYRTPNGCRLLIMNDTYDPTGDKAINLLHSLNADEVYIQMCRNQNCFRARLSPKPWRIGVDRLHPTPGVWPIKTKWMAERSRWVKNYEEKSTGYAACRYLFSLGSEETNNKAEFVRQIHDDACRVNNGELVLA